MDNGTLKDTYVYGLGRISAGTGSTYYLYNGHGDVVKLSNISGTVTKSYDYDAFGVECSPEPDDTIDIQALERQYGRQINNPFENKK